MKKNNIGKVFKQFKNFVSKNKPTILTVAGVACATGAVVLTVKATTNALQILEDEVVKNDMDGTEVGHNITDLPHMFSMKDKIRLTWKCYIPPISMLTASNAFVIGANSENNKRNAALSAAYNLSRATLHEYKNKVIENIGEQKEKAIREQMDKDKVEHIDSSNTHVYITEKGNTLCLDVLSKRIFTCDIDRINRAVNDLNARMLVEDYISLNDFYYEIGLDPINLGKNLGWNMGRDGFIKIDYSAQITEDNKPCIVLNYLVEPREQFNYATLP